MGFNVSSNGFKGGSALSPTQLNSFVDTDANYANTFNDRQSTPSLFLGVDLNKNYALEFGYSNFGNIIYSEAGGAIVGGDIFAARCKARALSISAVGKIGIGNKINLIGKIGFARWEYKKLVTNDFQGDGRINDSISSKGSSIEPVIGLGVSYQISDKFSLLLNISKSKSKLDDVDVNSTSFGVKFNFGK